MITLLLFFSVAHASPETDIISNPSILAREGWKISEKGGVTIATLGPGEAENWKKVISRTENFEVSYFKMGTSAQNWDYIEATPDKKQVVSNTHCYPPPYWEPSNSKPKCTTVTAGYCASIMKLTDSKFFRSDISKLNECGKILERIKLDTTSLKDKHETGMSHIYRHFNKKSDDFVHSISNGSPISLFDVTSDYHACKQFEGKWVPIAGEVSSDSRQKTVR